MWNQKKPASGIVFTEEKNSDGSLSYEYIFNHSLSSLIDIKGLGKLGKYLGDDQSKKD